MNCLLKHVIEGNIKGRIAMKRKRGIRRKRLQDDINVREDTGNGKRTH
jgi:hypothetical protein